MIKRKSYEEWKAETCALFLKHTKCSWDDLNGDEKPLEQAYSSKDEPLEFVEWYVAKYDLEWVP